MNFPPLDIEVFKFLYPSLVAEVPNDKILFTLYDKQEFILGKFLEISCDKNFNGQLMELALAHYLAVMNRGDEGGLITGSYQFTKSVEQAIAVKASSDTRYNGSDYGVFYWNQTQYGVQIQTMVQQKMIKVLFTTGNMNPYPCKNPKDNDMYASNTLKIDNLATPKTIELLLELEQEILFFDTRDPANPRLSIDTLTEEEIDKRIAASQTIFLSSQSISITYNTTDPTQKVIAVKISTDGANALELKDDGLYVKTPSAASELVDGIGTIVKHPNPGEVAVDLKIASKQNLGGIQVDNTSDNQLIVDENGKAYVPPTASPDLSNYYTKNETNSVISVALEPINTQIENIDSTLAQQKQQITDLNTNITDETTRAKTEENNLQKQFPKFQNVQISNIVAENGISGTIDQTGILSLGLDVKNNYFVSLPLSDIGGEAALKTCSLVWSNGATTKAVEGLPIDIQSIGLDQGLYAVFKNPNVSSSGSIAYNLTLRMLVFFDGDIGDGTTNFTIGDNNTIAAFTTWIAGINPKGDFTQHTTDIKDAYPVAVNNYGITELEIIVKDPIYIENQFKTFFVGVDMAAWFTSAQGVKLMAFEAIDLILTPV